jgi:hypothetical protein
MDVRACPIGSLLEQEVKGYAPDHNGVDLFPRTGTVYLVAF